MTDNVNVPREAVEMANARYPNAGISGGFVDTILHHKRTSFIAGYEAAMLAAALKAEPVTRAPASDELQVFADFIASGTALPFIANVTQPAGSWAYHNALKVAWYVLGVKPADAMMEARK